MVQANQQDQQHISNHLQQLPITDSHNMASVNATVPVPAPVKNLLDTKFHHSIASEPFVFANYYGEDAQLATQFTFWLCHKFERDIFGCFKVDLNQFAADMGYKSKTHFQEKVADPFQFYKPDGKRMSDQEIAKIRSSGEFVYETRFHNMVYKMATITVKLKHKEDVGSEEKQTTKFENLIKKIDVYIDKKNRDKVYLVIQPSDFFVTNLSRAYLLLSKESFTTLAKSKKERIENLYIYISAWRNYAKGKNLTEIEMPFGKACEIIGVDKYKEVKHKKEKLKKYLEEIKISAPDLEFDYHFSVNGRWAYKPILIFKNNPPFTQAQKNELRIDLFDSILTFCMTEVFSEMYPYEFQLDYKTYFGAWMKNREIDREKKREAYCKAHLMTFNRKIEPEAKQVNFFLDNLRHSFEQAAVI
jgi:hypothetical protein